MAKRLACPALRPNDPANASSRTDAVLSLDAKNAGSSSPTCTVCGLGRPECDFVRMNKLWTVCNLCAAGNIVEMSHAIDAVETNQEEIVPPIAGAETKNAERVLSRNSQVRWTLNESIQLMSAVADGHTWSELRTTHNRPAVFPRDTVNACRGAWRRLVRNNISPDASLARASEVEQSEYVLAQLRTRQPFAADDPNDDPEPVSSVRELAATERQALMFTELNARSRSNGLGGVHPLFQQQHTADTLDFADLAVTLWDWQVARTISCDARVSAKLVPLAIILVTSVNDFASSQAGALGHMIYHWSTSNRGRYGTRYPAFFINLLWDEDSRDEYQALDMFGRFTLNSIVSGWHVHAPRERLLPILVECAELQSNDQADKEYVAHITITDAEADAIEKGVDRGPLILIVLPGMVLCTCAGDLVDSVGKSGTAREQRKRRTAHPKEHNSTYHWACVPSSERFLRWSKGKVMASDASLPSQMMTRLQEMHKAGASGLGVRLRELVDLDQELTPGV
ncbi:hypothetical protein LTR12_010989 [Friedmanniomyces endolithicus]|nr:hypothetical protein LTR12_010989 [Friedmanniomyces endolithicus]